MRPMFLACLAAASLILTGQMLQAQSRPNNATPELNRDQDDNVPDIIQYIVQQRRQWDFDHDSPEARAFTQLLNFGTKPCRVIEGRVIPDLLGDAFDAECRCMDGSVRLLNYDDRRDFTQRLAIDHIYYELPEIFVKKPEDDVVGVFKSK